MILSFPLDYCGLISLKLFFSNIISGNMCMTSFTQCANFNQKVFHPLLKSFQFCFCPCFSIFISFRFSAILYTVAFSFLLLTFLIAYGPGFSLLQLLNIVELRAFVICLSTPSMADPSKAVALNMTHVFKPGISINLLSLF